MNRALAEYYRCPTALVDFQLDGNVAGDEGYFRLGREAICFGSSSAGFRRTKASDPLYDASIDIVPSGGTVRLPFDPDEIIRNLRHERYRGNGNGSRIRHGDSLRLRSLYYEWLRPLLPGSVRKHLQRVVLSDWRRIPFPRWPVDGTVERILEQLLVLSMTARGIQSMPFIWFWPEGATSCVVMTHDVDQPAGKEFCPRVMDLDDEAGIKSSFQIVPEGRYPVSEGFLEEIRSRGFEVNIHDWNHDGRLFSSREEFVRRAERINEYGRRYRARGFRSGGLYRNPAWYAALEFAYDMSIPSVAHLDPQRGGCCSLMPFFIGEILELPLTTIQDYSLFHVLNDYSLEVWRKQVDVIGERHGLASFLVHPEGVIEQRARRTYRALLEYLGRMRDERNTWIALPGEVDRWWRERSAMSVVGDGHRWRIEGKGKERARLAFATLVGGSLAFTVEEGK